MSQPRQQHAYGALIRSDVEPFVPLDVTSALDVGCAGGGFGTQLRRLLGPDALVHGIDAVPESVAEARETGAFDEVFEGYFPDDVPEDARYDLVSFNDVLEHMVDPWGVLRATVGHLNPGGRVLATIPNVQYAPNVQNLLRGHWTYTETGILDKTHVRFFTRESIIDLLESSGYAVMTIAPVNSVWGSEWRPRGRRNLVEHAKRRIFLGFVPDAEWLHFVVIARPRG